MKHLIDKDAVLAEIENRIRACGNCYILDELASLHRTFDTLEVKEVDLEKELILWHKDHFKKEDTYEKYSGFYLTNNSQLDLAKHFFELGIKAQKGE